MTLIKSTRVVLLKQGNQPRWLFLFLEDGDWNIYAEPKFKGKV